MFDEVNLKAKGSQKKTLPKRGFGDLRELAKEIDVEYSGLDPEVKLRAYGQSKPDLFHCLSSNHRAIVGDFLLLLANPDEHIEFIHESTVGTPDLFEGSASEAVYFSKHKMRKAAKTLRDEIGLGRNPGGGRKTKLRYVTKAQRDGLLRDIARSRGAILADREFIQRLKSLLEI